MDNKIIAEALSLIQQGKEMQRRGKAAIRSQIIETVGIQYRDPLLVLANQLPNARSQSRRIELAVTAVTNGADITKVTEIMDKYC